MYPCKCMRVFTVCVCSVIVDDSSLRLLVQDGRR